jgi:hypothetical protein
MRRVSVDVAVESSQLRRVGRASNLRDSTSKLARLRNPVDLRFHSQIASVTSPHMESGLERCAMHEIRWDFSAAACMWPGQLSASAYMAEQDSTTVQRCEMERITSWQRAFPCVVNRRGRLDSREMRGSEASVPIVTYYVGTLTRTSHGFLAGQNWSCRRVEACSF